MYHIPSTRRISEAACSPVGFVYDAELQTSRFRNFADVPFEMKPPVLADRPKEEQLQPIQLVMDMAHLRFRVSFECYNADYAGEIMVEDTFKLQVSFADFQYHDARP